MILSMLQFRDKIFKEGFYILRSVKNSPILRVLKTCSNLQSVAKIAVAIWDKSGIQMNDASKRALGLSQSYQCRDIIEIANKPIIIVHYDTVSGMTPTR
jgi:hypothetical protein